MEIRVEENLTGRELREKILSQYGSRKELEAMAAKKDGAEARDDLAQLDLLEADPRRLSDHVKTTVVSKIKIADLERLTEQRLRLLHHLAKRGEPLSLRQLVEELGRDKKHLSNDLRVLEDLGILHVGTEGRMIRPHIQGNEIHITLEAS